MYEYWSELEMWWSVNYGTEKQESETYALLPHHSTSTHLLQQSVGLLVDDLAAPGTVLQLLIGSGGARRSVALRDAFVALLRQRTKQLPLDAIDGRLGLPLHAGVEGVGLRLQCWACHGAGFDGWPGWNAMRRFKMADSTDGQRPVRPSVRQAAMGMTSTSQKSTKAKQSRNRSRNQLESIANNPRQHCIHSRTHVHACRISPLDQHKCGGAR